jgi:hypothetical protein
MLPFFSFVQHEFSKLLRGLFNKGSNFQNKQSKMDILSVLRVSLNFKLDSTVLNLINNNGEIATGENIHHLADAVYEILEVTR